MPGVGDLLMGFAAAIALGTSRRSGGSKIDNSRGKHRSKVFYQTFGTETDPSIQTDVPFSERFTEATRGTIKKNGWKKTGSVVNTIFLRTHDGDSTKYAAVATFQPIRPDDQLYTMAAEKAAGRLVQNLHHYRHSLDQGCIEDALDGATYTGMREMFPYVVKESKNQSELCDGVPGVKMFKPEDSMPMPSEESWTRGTIGVGLTDDGDIDYWKWDSATGKEIVEKSRWKDSDGP